jgi:SP family facilitated glucose transporter-like MFS transporter 3
MTAYLGPYSFVPFAAVLLGAFLFSWIVLPETQGTTPEQLLEEMSGSLSQRSDYKTNRNSTTHLDQEWHKAMQQLQEEEDGQASSRNV